MEGRVNQIFYPRPKIWGDMELYMSKESLDAVKANGWKVLNGSSDPELRARRS